MLCATLPNVISYRRLEAWSKRHNADIITKRDSRSRLLIIADVELQHLYARLMFNALDDISYAFRCHMHRNTHRRH